MRTTAIIAAGGRGRRMGAAVPKQLLTVGGRPMLEMSFEVFARHPRVAALVVVLPEELVGSPPTYLRESGKPTTIVPGGERRQDSVARGFAAVPPDSDVVLVHDAARPLVDRATVDRVIDAAAESGAAICAVRAHDTVKVVESEPAQGSDERLWIDRTLPRERVFLAQTPQGFRFAVLADAVRLGQAGVDATDEAFLAEQAGHRVRIVPGSASNLKITSRRDLELAQVLAAGGRPERQARHPEAGTAERARETFASDAPAADASMFVVGTGYDLHRLVEGRPLVIGGVHIPHGRGPAGHSDGDPLCHALTDAILGAAGAGDIGRHFPDTDERWRGASSVDLLRQAARIVEEKGFHVVNVDAVVILERPKVAPHQPAIASTLSDALGVPAHAISVKGKTNEGLGDIGRGDAIACHAVALLRRN